MRVLLVCALSSILLNGQQAGRASEWVRLGRQQLVEHKFEQAKQSALQAIDADPGSAESYGLLGEAERELDDFNGAYRAWLKANTLDPRNVRIPYYLGRLFYEANVFNEAAAWFRETLKLDPKHYAAMTYLGLSAEAMGMQELAVKLYRASLAESKAQGKPFSWAFLSLAKLLRQQGYEGQALALLEEGEKLCPEAHLLTTLGAVLADGQKTDRAETALRRAVAMDPGIAEAHYRLSRLLNSEGRDKEAELELDQFRKAKLLEPQNRVLAIQNK